jgi:hypothetical protein
VITRLLAVLVAAALTVNCAAAAYQAKPAASTAAQEPAAAVTAEYLRALPVAARVKVRLTDGESFKGDLMVVGDTEVVVQPRTRIPVGPRTVRIDRLASVEMERENHLARAIAIGAASGAAAALGVFLALIAVLSD